MNPKPLPPTLRSLAIELPSWVGDAVMATPVLRAARRRYPEARIIGLMRPGLDQLLEGCADLDERIVIATRGLRGVFAAARALRATRADAIVLLPNSFRSALAARLARIPIRAGYARDGRGFLLTHPVAPPDRSRPIPAVEYYASLARHILGVDNIDRHLELKITEPQENRAREILQDVEKPFILLNPGANKLEKRWPAERFAQLARALYETLNVSIIISGSPGEQTLVSEIVEQCGSCATDLAARSPALGSLKAIIHRALLLVTNDTGPRHIAAAVGTPSVVLFGPTDHRWTTLPEARERLLFAEPFLPQEQVADRAADLCAIDRIPVSDVIAAVQELLRSSPSSKRFASSPEEA